MLPERCHTLLVLLAKWAAEDIDQLEAGGEVDAWCHLVDHTTGLVGVACAAGVDIEELSVHATEREQHEQRQHDRSAVARDNVMGSSRWNAHVGDDEGAIRGFYVRGAGF